MKAEISKTNQKFFNTDVTLRITYATHRKNIGFYLNLCITLMFNVLYPKILLTTTDLSQALILLYRLSRNDFEI